MNEKSDGQKGGRLGDLIKYGELRLNAANDAAFSLFKSKELDAGVRFAEANSLLSIAASLLAIARMMADSREKKNG